MAKYTSGRQRNLKVGISSYSENLTSVEIIGKVGIGTTNAPYSLSVLDNSAPTEGLLNAIADFGGDVNSYSQVNIRNASTGSNASADLVLTADNGNNEINFLDLGINNTGFGTDTWTINGPTDGYLYASDGNLSLGVGKSTSYLSLFSGGTLAENEKVRFTNTGVGIGTTTTESFLNVSGDVLFEGTTDNELLRVSQLGSGPALIVTHGANPNTNSFVVNNNGQVGVGVLTISPEYILEVDGGDVRFVSGSQGDVIISHSNLVSKIRANGTVQLALGANGQDAIRINLDNYIGVGTSIPTSKLTVQGDVLVSGIITANQFSTGTSGINISTDTISGPSIMYIDPAPVGVGTTSGIVRIKGDLYVDGTQFVINSSTIELADLRVGIATTVGSNLLLDGGGIGIGSANILKTFIYNFVSDSLKSSENIDLASGKVYKINGTELLSSSQLTVANINSSGVGTIATFNSTNASITSLDLQRLRVAGISTFTNGPVLIGSGSQTGTLNQSLQVTGGAYISTYVGIGYTNPFSNLTIYDDNGDGAWISLVDPGQSSSAIENNNGTLYIRAEEGAGNSKIVFQTGTSNYKERPSVSGSDRVEIDSLGNLLVNMGTPTGVSNQRLQVTGGGYVSGNTGIGLSIPTSKLQVQGDVLVSGVVTATTFYGNLYGTGISTIGLLNTQNLNVSGIITGGSYYVDGTQVISNSRQLQNIASLDTITTATIEAAISNAPNDFQTLNVAGVSTFVNGPVQIGSGTSTGTASQRLQVTGGGYVSANFGVGVTNPTSKLQVQGDVLVSGVVTATTFNGQINSGLGTITTLSGTNLTYTNSDFTNLNADYGYIDVGIVTDLTNTRLTSGIATITTLNSTQSNLTNINSTGISTLNILQANTLQVSGIATFQDNVYLGINDVLNIGGANYLKLFHDGGAGYIDNDTGILYYNSGQHFFQNAAGTEVLASFTADGGASLYFDNSKKLETVGTGVTVTGTVYAQNFSTGSPSIGINISNNSITGPSSIVIDPAAIGDDTGAVRIKGDLYVDGTQFIVNSSTIDLADLRVGIATTVGSNLLLDGGGIGIGSANVLKTFTYNYSSDSLKSSENLDLASGRVYKIDGTEVLSSTTLGSGVVNSSLTSVGTLTQLNVAGVGTIPTLNSANADLKDITSERVTVSGIVTANSFRPSSGYIQAADGTNSLYIYNSTGNVAFQGTIGVGQINNASGFQVITFNNIDTRLTGNLDIAGVTTSSVFNGNVYSLGVSTFRNGPVLIGSGTSTGSFNQPLQVTGGGYISTNLGIGSTNPQYLLDVNGDINFNGLLYQNNQPFIASRWSAGLGNDIYRMSQVGIGTTNPEYNLDVLGDVRIRGGLYDNLNNSAGLLDYVVVADGFGGWSWQPVTAAGAGTLDGIEVRDQGNVVGTSGSITTLDFRSIETSNIVVSGYAGGNIATITLSDEPIFATLGVLKSSGLGIATANTLQVSGISTLGNLIVSGISTFQSSIYLGDNDFAYFGDSNDLYIGHNGSVSAIADAGTGDLYIAGDNSLIITDLSYAENKAKFNTNGSVELYYDNSKKFETSGVGVTVYGDAVVNGGTILIGSGTSTGTATQTLQVTGGGYVSGSLGIGTTNPQYKLDVAGDLNFNGNLYQNGTKFTSGIGIGSTAVNPLSGVITPTARIGIGFTDINFVGTGLSITGYGSTVVIDFGNIAAGSGGASVSISTVSPGISTAAGNLWWDSTIGDLKIYYNDGNSAQWVDANGGSSVVTISESAPPGALNGDLWWDSTYGILKVYYDDGTSSQWVDANSGAYINYWIPNPTGIHTTGNVGVGTTIPNEKLQVDGYLSIDNNVSYGTTIATTSSTSQVGIHSALPIATYRSVEYTIQATQGTNFHTTKIIALHDGSLAYPTEYGSVFNTAAVATYDVDVSGGNIRLLATPASSSTTTYKIVFDAIKV